MPCKASTELLFFFLVKKRYRVLKMLKAFQTFKFGIKS